MIISPKLISALLVSISQMTGYSIPGEPPRVRPMSHAQLAEEVCGKPCGVLAFTTPTGEVLIDESLMIGRDPAATSILVHELTHYLQVKSQVIPAVLTCDLWSAREREAYDVQYRWLRLQAPNIRVYSFEVRRLDDPILPDCPEIRPLPTGG
ncbi:hypothetical protein [Dongia sp.]|uniref:hypothetical protein n=1 Tax=Dongia sp. TaxID=1977262 RepID=UPI0037529803